MRETSSSGGFARPGVGVTPSAGEPCACFFAEKERNATCVALFSSQALIYFLAKYADLTVNGQSYAILTILVIGAGTDAEILAAAEACPALAITVTDAETGEVVFP